MREGGSRTELAECSLTDEKGVKKRTATQKLVYATNYAPTQAKLRSAEESEALRFVKHVNSHSERIDGWIADNFLTAASTTAVANPKKASQARFFENRCGPPSPTGEC